MLPGHPVPVPLAALQAAFGPMVQAAVASCQAPAPPAAAAPPAAGCCNKRCKTAARSEPAPQLRALRQWSDVASLALLWRMYSVEYNGGPAMEWLEKEHGPAWRMGERQQWAEVRAFVALVLETSAQQQQAPGIVVAALDEARGHTTVATFVRKVGRGWRPEVVLSQEQQPMEQQGGLPAVPTPEVQPPEAQPSRQQQ